MAEILGEVGVRNGGIRKFEKFGGKIFRFFRVLLTY